MSTSALTLKIASGNLGQSLQVSNTSGKPFSLQGWQLLFIDRQGVRRLYNFPSNIEGRRWWLDPGEVVELVSAAGVDGYSGEQGRFRLFLSKKILIDKTLLVSILNEKGALAGEAVLATSRQNPSLKGLACPSCSTSVQNHWVFCQHCGESLVEGITKKSKGGAFGLPKAFTPGSRWFLPSIAGLAVVVGLLFYAFYQPSASGIVTRSEQALDQMGRWKTVLTIGGEERWRQEVIEPDRYKATIFHPDGALREIIWIGKKNYSRRIDAEGNESEWILNEGNQFDAKVLRRELMDRYIKPLQTLEGEQKTKGSKNYILEGRNTMGGKLTVLVDSSTDLPVKIEEEVEDPGKGSTRNYVTLVEQLGDDVTIEAPKMP